MTSQPQNLTLDTSKQLYNSLITNQVEWIFGYGSLIWKVDFPFDKKVPGYIKNFKRRFWLKSEDHRGTVESPGRVLSLFRTSGEDKRTDNTQASSTSTTNGIAYHLPENGRDDILKHLAIRERGGYKLHLVDFHPIGRNDQENIKVAVFLGEENGILTVPNETINVTSQIIKTSIGPSGKNIDYFNNLLTGLEMNGLELDEYLIMLKDAIMNSNLS